ncbi:hypothetical protein Tco_0912986, partial [Tanacetum coccineum]
FMMQRYGVGEFSNSHHWCRKDENAIPRGEHGSRSRALAVHVRTEVHSFVEEEVCTKSVDKEDVPDIVILEKNVKEQQMQIADMQRRLLLLEVITKRLNNGPSKVDHNVDNNVDHNAWYETDNQEKDKKKAQNKQNELGLKRQKPMSASQSKSTLSRQQESQPPTKS